MMTRLMKQLKYSQLSSERGSLQVCGSVNGGHFDGVLSFLGILNLACNSSTIQQHFFTLGYRAISEWHLQLSRICRILLIH